MAASVSGVFVGVAVSDVSGLSHLGHVETEVTGLRDLVSGSFEGEPLLNPSTDAVRGRLRTVKKSGLDGSAAVVALWSGHGVPSANGGLRLLAADSDADESDGLSPADFVTPLALSGASQLLLIVDTCYSGAALDASGVAQAVLSARPPDADHVWIGVLASTSDATTARDGVFAPVLERLLRDGPKDHTLRLRWSVHSERVRGDDLADAVLKEWDPAEGQQPQFLSFGSAWPIFANPLWRPDAPAQVVEHLLRAARGGEDDERSWFTGREVEVGEVVGWVRDPTPGVRVVTGRSGTGKSAIVGRVVSMSVAGERESLMRQDANLFLPQGDPGLASVSAHAHARALTPNRLAQVLDDGLVASGVLDRAPAPRNAGELVGALDRVATAAAEAWTAPVLVVDGLDESRAEAFPIATDVLNRLAAWCSVVVATRNVPAPDQEKPDLLTTLAPVVTMDISADDLADSGRRAMRAYVIRRLTDVAPQMDPHAVADYFEAKVGSAQDDPFLLARLVTAQLRAHPIDTDAAGWDAAVTMSVTDAVLADLNEVAPVAARSPADSGRLAHGLLAALTWGFGAGLPEEEWLAIAGATMCAGVEPPVGRDDVTWLLDQLGRYVVQDGENGEAVYRVAHQTLATVLRRGEPAAPTDERLAVAEALGRRYLSLLHAGLPAAAPAYLWRYFWRHAGQAGAEGIALLRPLVDVAPVLRVDLALALRSASLDASNGPHPLESVPLALEAAEVYRELAAADPRHRGELSRTLVELSMRYAGVGRRGDAVPPVEEAVHLLRTLAAEDPARRPDLADALNELGIRYAEVGRNQEAVIPIEESLGIYRDLAADTTAYGPDLARTLNNLGNRYGEVGRKHDALRALEESVRLRRQQASRNPALALDLAMSLNNLGSAYSDVGRKADAIAPTEEAVDLRRQQVVEHPWLAPELAGSLANLGICYAQVGRSADAVAPTEEAVALRRAQAAANPGMEPDLAMALNNLANRYADVGRRADAVPVAEESVRRYRTLAADNRGYLPPLAATLANLGVRYAEVGRHDGAIACTEEAVGLYRQHFAGEPGYAPDLAGALNNLGIRYADDGRPQDAVAPTEEALALYRALAAGNAAYRPDLGMVLLNLGYRYGQVGRGADAMAATVEAVEIGREQAALNPAYRPRLAGALVNLGDQCARAGHPDDAIAPTEEAVALWRRMAAENVRYAPDLAAALDALANRYSDVGRGAEGVAPAEEAVAMRRVQAAENRRYAPELAGAVNNLGNRYADAGRLDDAVRLATEAVTRYRDLLGPGPRYAPELARALGNLGRHHAAAGGSRAERDRVWDDLASEVDPAVFALLLGLRASAQDVDPTDAAGWLRRALSTDGLPSELVAQLHATARTLRARDPQVVDAALVGADGRVPGWLTVAPRELELVEAWASAPSFTGERDVLLAHPELLDPTADAALEEFLLSFDDDQEVVRLRRRREAARSAGARAAYSGLVAHELAATFVLADLDQQLTLLTTRRMELLDPVVRDVVDRAEPTPATRRALALMTLADSPGLDRAVDALRDPDRLAALLADLAAAADAAALEALATLCRTLDDTGRQARGALFQALARQLAGDPAGRDLALADLRALSPDGLPGWAAELAALAARQPAAAALIEPLFHQPK